MTLTTLLGYYLELQQTFKNFFSNSNDDQFRLERKIAATKKAKISPCTKFDPHFEGGAYPISEYHYFNALNSHEILTSDSF